MTHEDERYVGFRAPAFPNSLDGIVAIRVDHESCNVRLVRDPTLCMKDRAKFTNVVGKVFSNLYLRRRPINIDRSTHIDNWSRIGTEYAEAPAASVILIAF